MTTISTCRPCTENPNKCIEPFYVCDRVCDCPESCSDETNCITTTQPPCDQFICDAIALTSKKCLNKTRVCDAIQDCLDNSDENPEICGNKSININLKTYFFH